MPPQHPCARFEVAARFRLELNVPTLVCSPDTGLEHPMICRRMMLVISMLPMGSCAVVPTAVRAQEGDQSCTGQLTQQLRRFSEKCISDLVRYVASQPAIGARIS